MLIVVREQSQTKEIENQTKRSEKLIMTMTAGCTSIHKYKRNAIESLKQECDQEVFKSFPGSRTDKC